MSDNVVDFNEALKRAEQEEQSHDNMCPHCQQQNSAIENFLGRVEGLASDSEVFRGEVEVLVNFVEYYTRRDTLEEIAHGIFHEIQDMDEE